MFVRRPISPMEPETRVKNFPESRDGTARTARRAPITPLSDAPHASASHRCLISPYRDRAITCAAQLSSRRDRNVFILRFRHPSSPIRKMKAARCELARDRAIRRLSSVVFPAQIDGASSLESKSGETVQKRRSRSRQWRARALSLSLSLSVSFVYPCRSLGN